MMLFAQHYPVSDFSRRTLPVRACSTLRTALSLPGVCSSSLPPPAMIRRKSAHRFWEPDLQANFRYVLEAFEEEPADWLSRLDQALAEVDQLKSYLA